MRLGGKLAGALGALVVLASAALVVRGQETVRPAAATPRRGTHRPPRLRSAPSWPSWAGASSV